ncbi:MAG: single-stranded DNA-binding protein [archaeon]|nr:single-stranded DNA-binding protein [archaeon]
MKAKELAPNQKNVELIVKVVEKTEPRQVTSKIDGKFHRVCDALVGDETACINLSLWDEKIDELKENNYYKITGAYTSLYRNSLTLNIGRLGKAEQTTGDFEAETTNNRSLEEF